MPRTRDRRPTAAVRSGEVLLAPARRCRRARRPGRIVLELVLVLPLFVVLIFGMVQFGFYFAQMQQVVLASRVGAEAASRLPGLPTAPGPVPSSILQIIDQQLRSAKLRYCRVRLEHNVGGTPVVLSSPTTGACDCGPTNPLSPPLPPGQYVRLTVCVAKSDLMPCCSGRLGLTFGCDDEVSATSVMRYEFGP